MMKRYLGGMLLCAGVTGAAWGLQTLESRMFGRAWLETLVLAILLGALVRTVWEPGGRYTRGIVFCGKNLLEIAVMLLGATVSAGTLLAAGPGLLLGVVGVVGLAIGVSYAIGRGLGLSPRMATLVACGNSICGNSAIAAVAPVIGAGAEDVAASIGFTAVLGVGVVFGLPWLDRALHFGSIQSGALAGLTVYAVPQVLAATAPLGTTAVQMGTLVKLVRVLMLGPVCLALSLMTPRAQAGGGLAWGRVVPWFILGFLALLTARSCGGIPPGMVALAGRAAGILTAISMAALGLGVDLRVVVKAGGRSTMAVVLSLGALAVIALGLIHLLRLSG